MLFLRPRALIYLVSMVFMTRLVQEGDNYYYCLSHMSPQEAKNFLRYYFNGGCRTINSFDIMRSWWNGRHASLRGLWTYVRGSSSLLGHFHLYILPLHSL